MSDDLGHSQLFRTQIGGMVNDSLRQGEGVRFQVMSNSMAPVIALGDSVTVAGPLARAPHRGDVVCFRRGESFVVHRVLSVQHHEQGFSLLTRGDSSPELDPRCDAANCLGLVCLVQKPDRVIDLRTLPWRILNRSVAALFLAQSSLRTWLEGHRRSVGGKQPMSVFDLLSRGLGLSARLGLRCALRVF